MRRPKRAISDPHPQTISHLRCDDLLQHIASECFRNVVPPSGPPDHATALIRRNAPVPPFASAPHHRHSLGLDFGKDTPTTFPLL